MIETAEAFFKKKSVPDFWVNLRLRMRIFFVSKRKWKDDFKMIENEIYLGWKL